LEFRRCDCCDHASIRVVHNQDYGLAVSDHCSARFRVRCLILLIMVERNSASKQMPQITRERLWLLIPLSITRLLRSVAFESAPKIVAAETIEHFCSISITKATRSLNSTRRSRTMRTPRSRFQHLLPCSTPVKISSSRLHSP
jgi:hypothetical protein